MPASLAGTGEPLRGFTKGDKVRSAFPKDPSGSRGGEGLERVVGLAPTLGLIVSQDQLQEPDQRRRVLGWAGVAGRPDKGCEGENKWGDVPEHAWGCGLAPLRKGIERQTHQGGRVGSRGGQRLAGGMLRGSCVHNPHVSPSWSPLVWSPGDGPQGHRGTPGPSGPYSCL